MKKILLVALAALTLMNACNTKSASNPADAVLENIHARKSVQDYILKENPREIQWLVKGNKVRFSWP